MLFDSFYCKAYKNRPALRGGFFVLFRELAILAVLIIPMSFEPLQSVFSRVASRYSLKGEFEAAYVRHAFEKLVYDRCGEKLACMVSAKYLKQNTLWVAAQSASAAQKLQLKAHILLKELQEQFGSKRITSIRIVQGD